MLQKLSNRFIYLSWSPGLITLFMRDLNHQCRHMRKHVSVQYVGVNDCVSGQIRHSTLDGNQSVLYHTMVFHGTTI